MKKIKITWSIAAVFLFFTIVQFMFVLVKKERAYMMPVFLPSSLMEKKKMNEADAGKEPISGITVDDLVRGILSLEGDEKLSLSKEQAGRIYPFLQKMADRKFRYLELRNLRHHLNEDLMDTGIFMMRILTEKQFNYIMGNRDEAVLLLEDVPSWEDMMKFLRKEKFVVR